jgi:hypothetical protein
MAFPQFMLALGNNCEARFMFLISGMQTKASADADKSLD